MATIPITVLPIAATTPEVQEMLSIFKSAFGPDPLMEFCFNRPGVPHPPESENIAKHLDNLANPHFTYHKAVATSNPTGPMLGVAGWYNVDDPHTAKQNIPWGDPSPNVHMECFDASLGVLRRWRYEYFKERDQPFAYMAILTVAPEAQRKGVGSALLREGLKEVDRRGLPTFIEASPAGLGLYKKFGWEEVCETRVNLKEFGGDDMECVTVGLIRPVGAKEVGKKEV